MAHYVQTQGDSLSEIFSSMDFYYLYVTYLHHKCSVVSLSDSVLIFNRGQVQHIE